MFRLSATPRRRVKTTWWLSSAASRATSEARLQAPFFQASPGYADVKASNPPLLRMLSRSASFPWARRIILRIAEVCKPHHILTVLLGFRRCSAANRTCPPAASSRGPLLLPQPSEIQHSCP